MAALVIPAKSKLAIARREPNLLAPNGRPTGLIRGKLNADVAALCPFAGASPRSVFGEYQRQCALVGAAQVTPAGIALDGSSHIDCGTFDPAIITSTDFHIRVIPGFSSSSNNRQGIFHFGSTGVNQPRLRLIWLNASSGLYVDTMGGFAYRCNPTFSAGDVLDIRFRRLDVGSGQFYVNGRAVTTINVVDASGVKLGFPTSVQNLILGFDQENASWKFNGTIQFLRWMKGVRPESDFNSAYENFYGYTTESANQSPFLISIPGGGGAETINADFISSVTSVYEPTLTTGAVTISADFVSAATSVYEPTVSAPSGTQDVTADFISSATSVHEPTVTTGAVTVTADFISSATSVHEPTLTVGAVSIAADFISSVTTVHEPTITVGAVTITADFVSAATSVYEPTVFSGSAIIPDFIAAATSVYEPTVTTGAVTIAADLIAAGTIVYEPSVSSAVSISADFIAAATSVHEPTVGVGAVTILADFISSGTIVYEPSIPFGQIISADFIAATSAVYEPSVTDAATIWTEISGVSTTWTPLSATSTIWTEI